MHSIREQRNKLFRFCQALVLTCGPTKLMTLTTHFMRYSFSAESGNLKAAKSFSRRACKYGVISATVNLSSRVFSFACTTELCCKDVIELASSRAMQLSETWVSAPNSARHTTWKISASNAFWKWQMHVPLCLKVSMPIPSTNSHRSKSVPWEKEACQGG